MALNAIFFKIATFVSEEQKKKKKRRRKENVVDFKGASDEN